MKRHIFLISFLVLLCSFSVTSAKGQAFRVTAKDNTGFELQAAKAVQNSDKAADDLGDFEDTEDTPSIADPLEPFNRLMFKLNDKLYFWCLKPIALGYSFIVPEGGRIAVRRFFSNLSMPVRFINDVLQFKFKYAGIALSRFVINSTIGVLGFTDPAEKWKLFKHEEDFGQTLGVYGAGPGFYITWPILGPSSLRDTFGLVGDFFTEPTNYLFPHDRYAVVLINAYRRVNETSLNIGLYEGIKKDSFDPYVSIRDGYYQHRESMVKE